MQQDQQRKSTVASEVKNPVVDDIVSELRTIVPGDKSEAFYRSFLSTLRNLGPGQGLIIEHGSWKCRTMPLSNIGH